MARYDVGDAGSNPAIPAQKGLSARTLCDGHMRGKSCIRGRKASTGSIGPMVERQKVTWYCMDCCKMPCENGS